MKTRTDITNNPVLMLGGGGQAVVLIDCLRLLNTEIIGITDPADKTGKQSVSGVPVIGDDDVVFQYPPETIRLVNALGSVQDTAKRRSLFYRFKKEGYYFASVVHPSAVISDTVIAEEGVQIMAGTVIQPACRIGKNTLINTRVSVDHDCIIGDHVHLAPGVILSGGVQVEEGAHVGAGVVVLQNVRIAGNSVVGAGAVVTKDVSSRTVVTGIPAKVVKR